jgi:hypothetical protein
MYIYTLHKNQNSTGGGSFAREFFLFCSKGLRGKEIKFYFSRRVKKVFLKKWTYRHLWTYVSACGARSCGKGNFFWVKVGIGAVFGCLFCAVCPDLAFVSAFAKWSQMGFTRRRGDAETRRAQGGRRIGGTVMKVVLVRTNFREH